MGASQVNPIKPIFTCFELTTLVVLASCCSLQKEQSACITRSRQILVNCHRHL